MGQDSASAAAVGARGSEGRAWLAVALWSLLIFATIPLARTLQAFVQDRLGREAFGWAVLVVVALATAAAVGRALRSGAGAVGSVAWLLGVGAIFTGYTLALLRGAPEEALHFVEYGVLGVLAYRACLHRTRDVGVYLGAALVGAAVGILDEAIQWATPRRYWGLRDVGLNAFASALVQVAIWKGVRPARVGGPLAPRSVRLVCDLALATLGLLALSCLNTPGRIAWYAERLPGLGFLVTNESVMLEYGHRVELPGVGSFFSRLDAQSLRRTDAARAGAAAAILDRFRSDADYQRFLEIHTPVRDPFLHEARVHLFRRDRYLRRARAAARRGEDPGELVRVALGEQRILEACFGETLARSSHALDPPTREWLEANAPRPLAYESRVSAELVVAVGERTLLGGFAACGALLLGLRRRFGG